MEQAESTFRCFNFIARDATLCRSSDLCRTVTCVVPQILAFSRPLYSDNPLRSRPPTSAPRRQIRYKLPLVCGLLISRSNYEVQIEFSSLLVRIELPLELISDFPASFYFHLDLKILCFETCYLAVKTSFNLRDFATPDPLTLPLCLKISYPCFVILDANPNLSISRSRIASLSLARR